MRHPYLITAATVVLLSLSALHAQNLATESKSAEISAFGGFTYQKPDIGNDNDKGGTFGVAYTRFFSRLPVEPSLELRGTYASGSYANERSVDFGLQVSRRFRHFHPYADFLIGAGSIVYAVDPVPYEHSDKGIAYTYGGGLDYDLVHNFRLRLDLQQQHWNLGFNEALAPNHPNSFVLTPSLFTIGVNYVFPFKPHVRDSSFR